MHSTVCVIVVNKISDGEKQHFFLTFTNLNQRHVWHFCILQLLYNEYS